MILALSVIGLVPLLLLASLLTAANQSGMQTQVLRTHTVAAHSTAERIGTLVFARRAFAESIAANPVWNEPRSEEARRFLQGALISDDDVEMIDIVTPSGDSVIGARRRGVGELPARAGLDAQQRSDPAVLRMGPRARILFVAALPEQRGFVRVAVNASVIEDALRVLGVDGESQMVLATRSGVSILGTTLAESFPPAVLRAAGTAKVEGSGVFREPTDGRAFVAAYAPVPETGWLVLTRQPAEVAEAIAIDMRRRALSVTGFALALVALLSWLAYRAVVKPIRDIVQAQRRLAGSPEAGGGGISDLRETFRLIERRIADQEDLGRVFIGRYQVVSILGQGGMGTVFRGYDPKLQRPVALKTVHFDTDSIEHDELLSTLIQEAVLIAKLSHPNIVSVFDIEDTPEAAFFAMELIEGSSLEDLLFSRGKLTTSETVLIGLAVAQALEEAHARGVLHHDIKPANVLLGDAGAIKVTDFGIAGLVSASSERKGMVFGTPGYIPPEAIQGETPGESGDIFALGVLLYECLSGVNPFARYNVRETFSATIVDTPPPISEYTDAEVAAVVTALMNKRAEDRPAPAAHVAAMFARIVQTRRFVWKPSRMENPGSRRHSRLSASWVPTISMKKGPE